MRLEIESNFQEVFTHSFATNVHFNLQVPKIVGREQNRTALNIRQMDKNVLFMQMKEQLTCDSIAMSMKVRLNDKQFARNSVFQSMTKYTKLHILGVRYGLMSWQL